MNPDRLSNPRALIDAIFGTRDADVNDALVKELCTIDGLTMVSLAGEIVDFGFKMFTGASMIVLIVLIVAFIVLEVAMPTLCT